MNEYNMSEENGKNIDEVDVDGSERFSECS
jgi:hypothetical protein